MMPLTTSLPPKGHQKRKRVLFAWWDTGDGPAAYKYKFPRPHSQTR